jgi:hypothetical protein
MGFFKDDETAAFDVGRFSSVDRKATFEAAATDVTLQAAAGSTGQYSRPTEVPLPKATVASTPNYYVDGTDSLANRGLTINLVHVPTDKAVRFKAFLTAFNETYSSDWSSENVYGRGDPIHMFKQTSRTLSLGWKIVAATEGEALENLMRLQRFIQMLYPTYTKANEAQTINQSPLVRLQMSNLIRNGTATGTAMVGSTIATSTTANTDTGLLGIIKNVSISHNLESSEGGVFELAANNPPDRKDIIPSNNILPKFIEIQMDFSVIHEHMVGWVKDGDSWKFGGTTDTSAKAFPYYVDPGAAEFSQASLEERITENQAFLDQVDTAQQKRTSYAATQNAIAQYNQKVAELGGPTSGGAEVENTIDNLLKGEGDFKNLLDLIGGN